MFSTGAPPRTGPPRGRLPSLKNPESLRRHREQTPSRRKSPATPKCCPNPDINEMDGQKCCTNCGTILNESNIVSEVTFGESSTGAAVVQGAFVGEGQRHARSMGAPGRRIGLGGEGDDQNQSSARGIDITRRLGASLGLSERLTESGVKLYRWASNAHFVQGRETDTVAGVCIYIGCRMEGQYAVPLMDIAEKVRVSVYRLGTIYKDLKRSFGIDDLGPVPPMEIEGLIMRYARKLEFGDLTHKVADDACAIFQRMQKDWITQGRTPAGLCGACLILAARMNNFRRSVREVVYVVKVTNVTIGQRMHEFKRTEASTLSIEKFREEGLELPEMENPPVIYNRLEKEEKKRLAEEEAGAEEEDPTDADKEQDTEATITTKGKPKKKRAKIDRSGSKAARGPPRRDADGFAIPDIPMDAVAATEAAGESSVAPPPKKRGRPPKDIRPIPAPSQTELDEEYKIEDAIQFWMQDESLQKTAEEMDMDRRWDRRHGEIKEWSDQLRGMSKVSNEVEVGEDEFDDDPEVKFCKLSPPEIEIKEKIWVTENADWLRTQHQRIMEKALEEARGGPKKPIRRRKRRRMNENDDGTPVRFENAAEATADMIRKKQPGFSRRIDYEKLHAIYGDGPGIGSKDGSSVSDTRSTRGSMEPSPAPSSRGTPRRLLDPEAPEGLNPREAAKRARASAQNMMLPTPTPSQATRRSTQPLGGEDEEVLEIIEEGNERTKPIEINEDGEDESDVDETEFLKKQALHPDDLEHLADGYVSEEEEEATEWEHQEDEEGY